MFNIKYDQEIKITFSDIINKCEVWKLFLMTK